MIRKISVVLVSYNHEKYITKRLETILNQTYPIYEIIILDDASNDNSAEILKKKIEKLNINYKFVRNEKNSGSPFEQWSKGIGLCDGDIIWIAESDDFSHKNFLKNLVDKFEYNNVGIVYSNSEIVDENDTTISDYSSYLKEIFPNDFVKWKFDYFNEGKKELNKFLIKNNFIFNVSSCLFKKNLLLNVLKKKHILSNFFYCSDWLFYIFILKEANIYYSSKKLNYHRRHKKSIFGDKKKLNFSKFKYEKKQILKFL